VVCRRVDLVDRVRRQEETTLASYDEAIALIVAVELAQIELLEKFFAVPYSGAKLAYGYSLGELTAVVASGLFAMQDALRLPLSVAADAVALTEGVALGVLFSRGPQLDIDQVQRLCLDVNLTGKGVVGISSILAPNTVLLLGQGDTLDRFAAAMPDAFPARIHLRKNKEQWPPMHTPIVWQRNMPNRVAVMMQTLPGGFEKPVPPLLSLVTGKLSYNDFNARDILCRWIDHPQRLWDAVYETLAMGVQTVIHVGPDPNLIPATFQRLSDNVTAQTSGRSLTSLGLRAMSKAVKRPWLTALLPSRSALLRAPQVEHIILEDWLLAQKAP
jgi:[acyl-carrier-protein] S-malonyltransferase